MAARPAAETDISDINKFVREFLGLFLFFWAVLLFLALISFDATDPSFNLVKSGQSEVRNMAGLFGSYASGFLNDFFGIGAFIWPAVFAGLGWAYISSRYVVYWWRWCGLFLLTLCLLGIASAFDISLGDLEGGGMVGNTLYHSGTRYLSPVGSALIWLFFLLTGIQLVFNFSWTGLYQRYKNLLLQKLTPKKEKAETEKKSSNFFTNFASRFSRSSSTESTVKPTNPVPDKADALSRFTGAFSRVARSCRTKLQTLASDSLGFIKKHMPSRKKAKKLDLDISSSAIFPDQPTDPQKRAIQDENIRIIDNRNDTETEEEPTDNHTYQPQPPPVKAVAVETPQPPVNVTRPENPPQDVRIFTPQNNSRRDNFPLPSPELLIPSAPQARAVQENYEERGRSLMACFNDFGIQGELVHITPGPVITRYEVRPAPGVRVNRIVSLGDDLSLALKAMAIRIQPVPGSNTIGIEIPNTARETVNFRELVESPQFQEGAGPLTIILGKNISGKPYMADLTKMPHLLVGGTTGAGKSVSLNAMLISLLYKLQPDELKLLLIDPKRVEMAVYADLPHLVHPVVTDMSDAKTALEWAIHEMQNRFDTIRLLGTRNVAAYNQRIASFGGNPPEAYAHLKPIPYLVIVIDELADLMLTAAREVESSIQRLLQLARAAAIHLILATQRPSVDVVTGLLKANLNCRIAFQVISKYDSKTILDGFGAEQLLGKGDMLFKPNAGALQRLHAPFLTDDEIQTVVNYWKQLRAPTYNINFARWSSESAGGSSGGSSDSGSDPLYADARAFVLEQGKASISLLQRHLKIGFNRSARLMEQFEKEGLISGADGSKPRTVIKNN